MTMTMMESDSKVRVSSCGSTGTVPSSVYPGSAAIHLAPITHNPGSAHNLAGVLADKNMCSTMWVQIRTLEKNVHCSRFWLIFESSQHCGQMTATPCRSILNAPNPAKCHIMQNHLLLRFDKYITNPLGKPPSNACWVHELRLTRAGLRSWGKRSSKSGSGPGGRQAAGGRAVIQAGGRVGGRAPWCHCYIHGYGRLN
jgi:hypothetical protein